MPSQKAILAVRRRSRFARAVASAAILAGAAVAHAADGVLEINQTCAVQTGCFAGDTAGFPVTITQPGSYVLTGNLSGFQAEAVRITTDDVTVDLGGFSILGPGACSGTPPSCSGAGSTTGVASEIQLLPIRNGLTVRNGHIRGVETGVVVGSASIVADLTIRNVSNRGIVAMNGSRIVRNTIQNVEGDYAIAAAGFGCLVSDNAIYNVANTAIHTSSDAGYTDNVIAYAGTGVAGSGRALGNNLCDNELCRAPVRKRYYLTQNAADGSQAPSLCAEGFHMASIWEVSDTSGLDYDNQLGVVGVGDVGEGPSAEYDGWGWIHSSALDHSCQSWTSGNGADDGNIVRPYRIGYAMWSGGDVLDVGPFLYPFINLAFHWDIDYSDCDLPRKVWCVQDD